jgi:hypothetical protein
MSIIAINGKIGSGKDTVGKIIQYLQVQKEYNKIWGDRTFEHFLNYGEREGQHTWTSDWETKKFATKLKQIVCLMTGCTLEQLEDQEFKKQPLPEEWQSNIKRFSDGLCRKVTMPMPATYREFLQTLGTESTRDLIHPNFWVNGLFSDYNTVESKWIITDLRFPNEALAIKNRDGLLIKVIRGANNSTEPLHYSETALDDYSQWDHIINNNGTIEELIEKVKIILTKEKFI